MAATKYPSKDFPPSTLLPPSRPTIDASLGVGMVGGVKVLYAILLALVLGVGCGKSKEGTQGPSQSGPTMPPQATGKQEPQPTPDAGAESPKTVPKKLIADPIVEEMIRYSLKKPEGELTNADLAKVTVLNLAGRKTTDTSLKEVAKLNKLTSLSLSYTKITDAGLKEMAELKQLAILRLKNNKLTNAGVAQLQKTLPKCGIFSNAKK